MRILDIIAMLLLVLGGINLGLVGILNYDLIIAMFENNLVVAHTLFFFIGLAAVYMIFRSWQWINRLAPPSEEP